MKLPFDLENPPLAGAYTSHLPETYPGSPVGPHGMPEDWAQRSLEAATMLSGHFLQNVALTAGWAGPIDALQELLVSAKKVADAAGTGDPLKIAAVIVNLLRSNDLVRAVLAEPLERVQEIIADALAGVIGGVVSAAEVIPIVGWVISIVKFVVRAIQINVSDATFGVTDLIEGFLWARVPRFSRADDDDATNAMLAVLEGGDWTDVWLPSTEPWEKRALTFSGERKLEGWLFGAGVGGLEKKTFSAIPGTAQLASQFYGAWSFERDRSGADIVPVRSISDIYPSVNQLAGLAWTFMQRATGRCCAVDLDKVEYTWGVWQGRGREWLETKSMRLDSNNVDKAIKIAACRTMAKGALGWRFDDNGRPLRTDLYPGSASRVGSMLTVAERVRAACSAQRKRIHRLLGTIACAYVPPEAPALRDVNLKVRYAAMRMALLKHDARYDVELALVPDAYYRNALHQSRAGGTLAAPGVPSRRRGSIDGSTPTAPELPDVPGGDRTPSTGGGEEIIALLFAAAALLAL